MNGAALVTRLGRILSLALMAGASVCFAAVPQINILKTNYVDRWITNDIEVRMPLNRFVNEYHTNWVDQVRTVVLDVYATNRVVQVVTNNLVVDQVQTNYWVACHTNWQTLNLTNWNTVVVFKTNWITQSMTNPVQIEVPVSTPLRAETVAPSRVSGTAGDDGKDVMLPVQSVKPEDILAIEAVRSGRLSTNNQFEVHLRARWKSETSIPVLVQQWRVERLDGSVLVFAQEPVFKRGLPAGEYRVQVKAQKDAASPVLTVKGLLTVPGAEALNQRLAKGS
jgi:hypothetical protein